MRSKGINDGSGIDGYDHGNGSDKAPTYMIKYGIINFSKDDKVFVAKGITYKNLW